MDRNLLYYGDNLEVLRKHIKDETIDLIYIDPPFNSKRNYNQIYNNIGLEDRAQAQAFIDTWVCDSYAAEGFEQILTNHEGRFQSQTIELIKGLRNVLKEGSLLAYLVSMTLRITELHRILKRTGSFYLHCDPTASHYLKLAIDAIFCSQGGDFRNEIIWAYESGGRSKKDFGSKHDTIFRYTKSNKWIFNADAISLTREEARHNHMKRSVDADGRIFYSIKSGGKIYRYYADEGVIPSDVWTEFSHLQQKDPERMGYPTQKPMSLLERIIKASSNSEDSILDAYCGCGTTIEVAHKLKRQWIGIDITYQSISLILKRLEGAFGKEILKTIILDGIPKDMASAIALAHKQDDRVRKEFEKWAVLTYSNNRAVISEKKGADQGVDGIAYFPVSRAGNKMENEKIIFQVKSGNIGAKDIRNLRGTMEQEGGSLGIFITLQEPTEPMRKTAHAAGIYHHALMERNYDRIQIVTIQDIIEKGTRLEMPLTYEMVKSAEPASTAIQLELK